MLDSASERAVIFLYRKTKNPHDGAVFLLAGFFHNKIVTFSGVTVFNRQSPP